MAAPATRRSCRACGAARGGRRGCAGAAAPRGGRRGRAGRALLGSPTLRVDGVDTEPGARDRTDYGVKCRLYRTEEGLRGAPPDAWVLDALQLASRRAAAPAGDAVPGGRPAG